MSIYDPDQRCEVCQEAATCHVADLQEVEEALQDEKDGRTYAYRRWEPADEHHFCDEHARGPVRKFLKRR